MYLIRGISNHIEDLASGRTYYYDGGLPDYESGETRAKLVVTNWADAANGDNVYTELAFGDDAMRLWQHLESLLKFDVDKAPQPAPAKAEICEGDTVGIIGTKYFGEVLKIRTQDGGRQYFLKRAYNLSEDQFLGWFAENMLDPENNVPDEYAAPIETPESADDDGFNPKADNGGLYRSTDVRCTDPDSVHYNRIGKVTHFYYDEEDGRGVFLAHIDVKFDKDRSVTLEPRQVIDIPF